MLQIKKILLLIFWMIMISISTYGQQAELPKWLMEDAFDGEYIKPFDVDVVTPVEVKAALKLYEEGNYQEALGFLRKIRELNLPDGRLDFFVFIIAECNRMLRLDESAVKEYTYVATRFEQSDKVPPSLFRLLEFAVDENKFELADSLYQVFSERYTNHPLITSVKYTAGRAFYIQKKYDNALKLLSSIPEYSIRSNQAIFLSSLCYIAAKEPQKALALLDKIIRDSKNVEMVSEATIIAGDQYYLMDKLSEALKYYAQVSNKATRYKHSVVKTAKTLLDLGDISGAERVAKKFIKKEKSGEYFFEMATILEQAYAMGKKDAQAITVRDLIHEQLIDSRLMFEIYEEIDKLTDVNKEWQLIEHEAIRTKNADLASFSQKNQEKIKNLNKQYRGLLNSINPGSKNEIEQIPHLLERRYLASIKQKMQLYEDSITALKGEIEYNAAIVKSTSSAEGTQILDSLEDLYAQFQGEFEKNEQEYLLVEKECFGNDKYKGSQEEEMQARFVDWAFILYQDKNTRQVSLAKQMSDLNKQSKADTTKVDSITQMIKKIEDERSQNAVSITDERERLIQHIETMLDVYPKNRFNAHILFRLAELYYDQAGEIFQKDLRAYEAKMASGTDTSNLEFPEYNLDKVVSIYDDIIVNYPFSELADDAGFYKALALQKQGFNEEANDALVELTEKYPESEYYAEANMNIGRFYFEHPKIEDNQGYRLAEEAYRKVLFFRDHPQYVQALYHLGWCYYMQDRYEEAIAAFKYLVEENKLDFDPTKMDEKQVVNPLLRGEAIDYIAISFDEEGKIDDAAKFLQLIGNVDYSAMVLKRIAELREEDLDYNSATSVYKKLLEEYSLSSIAPEASINMIKLYEGKGLTDSAMIKREEFFKLYAKGGIWQETMKKDTLLLNYIDSLSIVMGLFVADEKYRIAEESQNVEHYRVASEKYRKIVEKYPESKNAAEARWNLAAISEQKTNDKPTVYENYLKYSQLMNLNASRREQAALNAIAIAQSVLPEDTGLQNKNIDFASMKVIESIQNYNTLFPLGESAPKVMMSMAAIYFNRKMFSKAAEIYTQILESNPQNDTIQFEAWLLLGKCKFGEEIWQEASGAFEKVWKQSNDQNQRSEAYSLLLQSEFLNAKNIMSRGDIEKAAAAFRSIEDRFPGSEFGDIVLFNASEAYEKMEKWLQAADNYLDLVSRYPQSQYAPDALFNAALDYEKIDKFNKAADAYETIIDDYSESDKAKDALFNLGFCYEKLGKMDKVAEVNERYSLMYPGEKDVEAMLLRSAAFYARTKMYDKAIVVYKNFVRRYPKTPKAIEALFMIAKCSYDQNDFSNALFGFNNTETQNNNFALDGLEQNNYYAAEAAYYTGVIKRNEFLNVSLTLPLEQLQANLKEKSNLLNDAAKAFQRVIQYQSERMFEAAFRVGELYEDFANAINGQERQKLDPIKAAVNEKDIKNLVFQIMQNSFIPYAKVLEIASEFDSLTNDQNSWVVKSKAKLENNILSAGTSLTAATQSMQNAPIPKEIKEKALHYYQYQKQVLETLESLKTQIAQYYKNAISYIDSLGLSDSVLNVCKDEYANSVFRKGYEYDSLSLTILKSTENLPGNLSPDEKEDLIFQLEDIVFELQDKSIRLYEDAVKALKDAGITSGTTYNNIVENLARLDPDRYGSSFYELYSFGSNDDWLIRPDSVDRWNGLRIPNSGWSYAQQVDDAKPGIGKNAFPIKGDTAWEKMYVWSNAFVPGIPRDGSIYIKHPGKYRLFINGSLILSDTSGSSEASKIDSATGITSLLKGGDNAIAAEVFTDNSKISGTVINFSVLVDTTTQFKSSVKIPQLAAKVRKKSSSQSENVADSAGAARSKSDSISTQQQLYKNSKDVARAIEEYKRNEAAIQSDIKKERLEIQRLKIQLSEVELLLKETKTGSDPAKPKN